MELLIFIDCQDCQSLSLALLFAAFAVYKLTHPSMNRYMCTKCYKSCFKSHSSPYTLHIDLTLCHAKEKDQKKTLNKITVLLFRISSWRIPTWNLNCESPFVQKNSSSITRLLFFLFPRGLMPRNHWQESPCTQFPMSWKKPLKWDQLEVVETNHHDLPRDISSIFTSKFRQLWNHITCDVSKILYHRS